MSAAMKRKTPPTKTYKRPAKKAKTASTPLAQQRNTVRAGPEKKDVQQTQTLTVPAGGAGVVSSLLTPLAQGVTNSSRIGRKVRLMKITVRWYYLLNAAETKGGPCRVKIVYDKQCNGQAATGAGVLQNDTFTGMNNLDYSDRFITLADWETESLSVENNFTTSGMINRKIDLEQIWNGNVATGTIADLATGSVYLIAWQVGCISSPSFFYNSRIRFEDF